MQPSVKILYFSARYKFFYYLIAKFSAFLFIPEPVL